MAVFFEKKYLFSSPCLSLFHKVDSFLGILVPHAVISLADGIGIFYVDAMLLAPGIYGCHHIAAEVGHIPELVPQASPEEMLAALLDGQLATRGEVVVILRRLAGGVGDGDRRGVL